MRMKVSEHGTEEEDPRRMGEGRLQLANSENR